uniref:Uncharacterized protein n=1 Tax=Arundo donax TaxID=35708 RepID=A0A0A9FDR6_ARUDO
MLGSNLGTYLDLFMIESFRITSSLGVEWVLINRQSSGCRSAHGLCQPAPGPSGDSFGLVQAFRV